METVREGLRQPRGQDGVISALDILGQLREERAVLLFKQALNHSNNGTCTSAALALCWCGDLQGLASLKQWASDISGNPKRAVQAIYKLAKLAEIGDPHGIATLRNLQRERGTASILFQGEDRTVSWIVDSMIGPLPGAKAADTEAVIESNKAGGCFVATAACGDPFAPEVIALTAFRDDVLSRSAIGRILIRVYYAVSPPIAGVIARSTHFAALQWL